MNDDFLCLVVNITCVVNTNETKTQQLYGYDKRREFLNVYLKKKKAPHCAPLFLTYYTE